MKSKELKIYNIPQENSVLLTMSIKPRRLLSIIMWVSMIILFTSQTYSVIGTVGAAISIFALVAMPDRVLLSITETMVVVYDSQQPDTCFCIYWDELLNWQYARKQNYDKLYFELVDGQKIACDIYPSRKLFFYLNLFASGKEKKMRKRKKN